LLRSAGAAGPRRSAWASGIPASGPVWQTRARSEGGAALAEDDRMNAFNQDFPVEAVAALERGSKIDAIKCVRVARGVGLKEAKDIVEQFIDSSPSVKSRMESANAQNAKGGLRWLFLITAIALAAYLFYTGKL
jgi:ribosomal protein L7/L12